MFGQKSSRLILLGTALSAALFGAGPSRSQSTLAPPRQDSSSPTGVSFRSGSLSRAEEDLSIGGGMPTGLALERSYNSAVNRVGPGRNWLYSVDDYVSIAALPVPPGSAPPAGQEPYIYNVTLGGRSIGFLGGSTYHINTSYTGGPVGTYTPSVPGGASLVFNGTNAFTGNYTFTDADGTVINFTPGPNGKASNWTMPDGTRLDYTYSGVNLRAIISSRGWAMLFDGTTKVCVVNMAQTYVTSASTCPSDAQAVTYTLAAGAYNPAVNMLSSATRAGRTTSYFYNGKDHLNCVKDPGQSVCKLQTTWGECLDDPMLPNQRFELHLHDFVTTQQDATGKTYAYSYTYDIPNDPSYPVTCPKWQDDSNDDYRDQSNLTSTMTEAGTATTTVRVDTGGMPFGVTDPLGRTTVISLDFVMGPVGLPLPDTAVSDVQQPEGNNEHYARDARGNVTSKTINPKSGSGLSPIVTSASYPSSCTNSKTCNKPTTVTDANGNVSSFSYDTTHGGVLTETGPADAAGVHPVKRYAYVQRYAWIKNAGGTFSRASSPVWLLDTMKTCRTSATVSGACAAGSSDEVVTQYEYGPDTGAVGNNLLVRGVAVTADGVTLRTCYGYDRDGNKIFETKPNAGLTVCS